jgi:hypothetical protein
VWGVNLLPSVWKHHTLNPRLSTMTGISRESAGTSRVQSFPLDFPPGFWIWGHTAWLFCFMEGVLYPRSLKVNGDHSNMHFPVSTQHLHESTPISIPSLMEANNCHHMIMDNYKMRLAGSCEYNNEPSWPAEPSLFYFEPSLPSQGRFCSTELIWTEYPKLTFFPNTLYETSQKLWNPIISYNPKDTLFIWDVITFLVNITPYVNYKFKEIKKLKFNNAF